MNAADEVARIKREFAERDGAWRKAIVATILANGPSSTSVLRAAAFPLGYDRRTASVFSSFLNNEVRTHKRLVVVGQSFNASGCCENTWSLSPSEHCRARGTGQCAPACLQHSAAEGRCPEAELLWSGR